MRNLFFIAVIGLVSLLSGCGEDNGKYAGIWERKNNGDGSSIRQYEITKKDNGYKILYKRRSNEEGSEFKTISEMYVEKSGSYFVLNNHRFLEILNDNELKLVHIDPMFVSGSDEDRTYYRKNGK